MKFYSVLGFRRPLKISAGSSRSAQGLLDFPIAFSPSPRFHDIFQAVSQFQTKIYGGGEGKNTRRF